MKVAVCVCLIFAVIAITFDVSPSIQFWAYLVLFFPFNQPPPVSNHFFVHRGWSLMRELTVALYFSAQIQQKVGRGLSESTRDDDDGGGGGDDDVPVA